MVARNFGMPAAQGRGALLGIGDGELHTRLDLIEWLEPALDPPPDAPDRAARAADHRVAHRKRAGRVRGSLGARHRVRVAAAIGAARPASSTCAPAVIPTGSSSSSSSTSRACSAAASTSSTTARVVSRVTAERGRRAVRALEAVGTVGRRRRTRRAEPAHARAGATRCRAGAHRRGRRRAAASSRWSPRPTIRRPRCTTCSSPATSPRGSQLCRRRPTSSASSFHGMAVSHIDALCHVFVDGQMYNGFPASDVTSRRARGATRSRPRSAASSGGACCSTSRGCAASSGSSPATRSRPTSSTPRVRAQQVAAEPGDILLVSTGRDARRARARRRGTRTRSGSPASIRSASPGCATTIPSVLGSDGVSDVLPANRARVADPDPPVPARRDGRAPARQPPARPTRGRPVPRPAAVGVPVRRAARCRSAAAPARPSTRWRCL